MNLKLKECYLSSSKNVAIHTLSCQCAKRVVGFEVRRRLGASGLSKSSVCVCQDGSQVQYSSIMAAFSLSLCRTTWSVSVTSLGWLWALRIKALCLATSRTSTTSTGTTHIQKETWLLLHLHHPNNKLWLMWCVPISLIFRQLHILKRFNRFVSFYLDAGGWENVPNFLIQPLHVNIVLMLVINSGNRFNSFCNGSKLRHI